MNSPRRVRLPHLFLDRENQSPIVFLTVCAKQRRPILANPDMVRRLVSAWMAANHWLVGRFVVMPDHLHLFCSPNTIPPESIADWVRYWKSMVGKSAGTGEGGLWQRDFWDTQLRMHESYRAKWEYVRYNPVRARLVAMPGEWPYQGELNVLRWHD